VISASKPSRPGASGDVSTTRPTAQELDQTLASLTDDDEDEASFADLNDEPAEPAAEADAPAARSKARSSSSSSAAAASPSSPPKEPVREPGVPTEITVARTVKIELNSTRARMTVEAVDDDEWPDE
jgi:hypothetical protein